MALCATAPAIAAAQDKPAAPPARKDSTHFTADLRFVSASGNASSNTLSTGDKLTHWAGPWSFGQELAVVYGRNDQTTVANFYHGALRGKYAATARFSALTWVVWERDTPAGLVQRFEEGVGVGYQPLDLPHDKLALELGPTLVQERHSPPDDKTFGAARVSAAYHHLFPKKAVFEQLFEWLPNLQDKTDYRVNARSTLTVPLAGAFALSIAYDFRYTNTPPAGLKTSDRFLTAGLQLAL